MQDALRLIFRKYKIDDFVYPLFYCLPFALRFEPKNAPEKDAELFRQAFAKDQDVLVVVEDEPEAKFSALLEPFACSKAIHERYNSEDGSFLRYPRFVYNVPTDDMPIEKALNILLEFPEIYRNRVFFAAPESGILMTVYDKRGCDIAAPRRELLQPLFDGFKDCLSEIDLPQMRMNFEF